MNPENKEEIEETKVPTASSFAKKYGLKELKEVIRMTGVSAQTLNNWFNNKPRLFEIVVIGCAFEQFVKTMVETKQSMKD